MVLDISRIKNILAKAFARESHGPGTCTLPPKRETENFSTVCFSQSSDASMSNWAIFVSGARMQISLILSLWGIPLSHRMWCPLAFEFANPLLSAPPFKVIVPTKHQCRDCKWPCKHFGHQAYTHAMLCKVVTLC